MGAIQVRRCSGFRGLLQSVRHFRADFRSPCDRWIAQSEDRSLVIGAEGIRFVGDVLTISGSASSYAIKQIGTLRRQFFKRRSFSSVSVLSIISCMIRLQSFGLRNRGYSQSGVSSSDKAVGRELTRTVSRTLSLPALAAWKKLVLLGGRSSTTTVPEREGRSLISNFKQFIPLASTRSNYTIFGVRCMSTDITTKNHHFLSL
jgi:hypothetical protein